MRFLLVQLKRIGDLVLTTPVIVCLREQYPDAKIVLAVEKSSSGLLPLVDHDEAIVFDRGKPSLRPWLALRKQKFDACLDFTGNDRAAAVCAMAKATRKIAWKRFEGKPLRRMIFHEFVESSVRLRHTADHHTDLLRPLGIVREGVNCRLRVPVDVAESAEKRLREMGLAGRFAVIHPGTARAEKYWEARGWAEVIRYISEVEGLVVLVTGSAAKEETVHLEAIRSFLGESLSAKVPDMCGQLSLSELAAVFCRSEFVCGVDSAPLHFSDALGVPAIAMFGPTNPYHWRPRATTSRILVPQQEELALGASYVGDAVSAISSERVIACVRDMLRDFAKEREVEN